MSHRDRYHQESLVRNNRNLTFFAVSASVSGRARAGSAHMVAQGPVLTLAPLCTSQPVTATHALYERTHEGGRSKKKQEMRILTKCKVMPNTERVSLSSQGMLFYVVSHV